MMLPMRTMAQAMQAAMGWPDRMPRTRVMRRFSAALELFDHLAISHDRPEYEIDHVLIGGRAVDVSEEVITATIYFWI